MREIAYASGESTLALRYSLRDMRVISRSVDGEALVAPMTMAWSADGGPRWVISRGAIVTVGRAQVVGGSGAKLLAMADDAGLHYVFTSFDPEPAPILLKLRDVTIECDAFGFGRVEYDPAAGVMIDVSGEIGAVRIIGDASMRLIINGADVTNEMTRTADGAREFRGLA